uniref:Uncharacterized protein n=1 Tax=Cannabis sativa TaxID=3483 RepID=A0A803QI31_CANSA
MKSMMDRITKSFAKIEGDKGKGMAKARANRVEKTQIATGEASRDMVVSGSGEAKADQTSHLAPKKAPSKLITEEITEGVLEAVIAFDNNLDCPVFPKKATIAVVKCSMIHPMALGKQLVPRVGRELAPFLVELLDQIARNVCQITSQKWAICSNTELFTLAQHRGIASLFPDCKNEREASLLSRKVGEVFTVKLLPIIRDNLVWNSKLVHNVFYDKVHGLFGGDRVRGLRFHPFDGVGIHEAQQLILGCGIHHFIDSQKGKDILGARLIKIVVTCPSTGGRAKLGGYGFPGPKANIATTAWAGRECRDDSCVLGAEGRASKPIPISGLLRLYRSGFLLFLGGHPPMIQLPMYPPLSHGLARRALGKED